MEIVLHLYFVEIQNDHEGWCSDSECVEEETGRDNLTVKIKKEDFWPEVRKQIESLKKGDFFHEGPLFEWLKEEYGTVDNSIDHGSGYCRNMSERFDIHTINTVLINVQVEDILQVL